MSRAAAFASWLPAFLVLILSILAVTLAAAPAAAPPARRIADDRDRLARRARPSPPPPGRRTAAADRIARLIRDNQSRQLDGAGPNRSRIRWRN